MAVYGEEAMAMDAEGPDTVPALGEYQPDPTSFAMMFAQAQQQHAGEVGEVGEDGTPGIYCGLGNYNIEKRIGRGQFSEVYRAQCIHNGAFVALKKVQVRAQNCACVGVRVCGGSTARGRFRVWAGWVSV
jgi:hypothetical protein